LLGDGDRSQSGGGAGRRPEDLTANDTALCAEPSTIRYADGPPPRDKLGEEFLTDAQLAM